LLCGAELVTTVLYLSARKRAHNGCAPWRRSLCVYDADSSEPASNCFPPRVEDVDVGALGRPAYSARSVSSHRSAFHSSTGVYYCATGELTLRLQISIVCHAARGTLRRTSRYCTSMPSWSPAAIHEFVCRPYAARPPADFGPECIYHVRGPDGRLFFYRCLRLAQHWQ
jgi:hypothetical protein